jgi:hypothetical protein
VEGKFADGRTPDFLLFLDADVVLRPSAVAELAALMTKHDAGLGSALPLLMCRSFWEHVAGASMAALVTSRYRPSQVNAASHAAALANGQFMLVTPTAYANVGGHERVRAEVLEDVALARNIKRAGVRLLLADGRRALRTRMYASLGELWQGWLKNAYQLTGGTPKNALGYAAGAFLLAWLPWVCAWQAVVVGRSGWSIPAAVWAAGLLVPLMCQMMLRRAGGLTVRYAFLAPVGALVVAALLCVATRRAIRREPVVWKRRKLVDGRGVISPPIAGGSSRLH